MTVPTGETVRSEAEIKDVRELFIATGDDPPAINTAVRDTLAWVLGGISTEELVEQYLVAGRDFQCFTCPAGVVRIGGCTDRSNKYSATGFTGCN